MMRPARSRRAAIRVTGYTLIELIIVISILGILAATMGPRFFDQSVFSQRGYADEVAAALRFTQKAAVITGCPARLVVAAAGYQGVQQAASGNQCDLADTTWSTALLSPDGSAIQGSAPTGASASPIGIFQFDAQGRLSASPSTTLSVGPRTISIDANSGFVQVQ